MAKAKYTRGADGRFQTKVWDGSYTPLGKKRYVPIYSTKSSADLEKRVNEMKLLVSQRNYVAASDIMFLDYARTWRAIYKLVREIGTQTMYDNIIEKHFNALEGVRLQDVQKIHFQLLINNAINHPRTCQQISLTFKQVITSAIQDRKLPAGCYADICHGIDLPKYIPKEKRTLTPEEKAAIKIADFTPREKAFIYLIYGCGLRRGEALALNRFTVDLKKRQAFVHEAVAFDKNTPYKKSTKNGKKREVPLPAFVVDYLSWYVTTLSGTNLFSSKNSDLMTKSSYDKMWANIVRKMNIAAGGTDELHVITDLTAHIFRHNYCSNLCYQIPNISIKKIAYLMGDTEKMVIEVYNHIMEEKENASAVVENAIAL